MVIYHPDGCNGAATFIYCHIYTLYAWQYFTNSKIFLGTINPLMKYSDFKCDSSQFGDTDVIDGLKRIIDGVLHLVFRC